MARVQGKSELTFLRKISETTSRRDLLRALNFAIVINWVADHRQNLEQIVDNFLAQTPLPQSNNDTGPQRKLALKKTVDIAVKFYYLTARCPVLNRGALKSTSN